MTDTRRRVKLYELNAERQWDDKGTGHVSSTYVERLKGISLVVRSEQDGSLLLESKIQTDTAYQKQQETLIVWSEGDNFDLALSFQERAGCDDIWEKICSVQGKDPSVDFTQDLVEDSEDDRGFDEISESAPPIELPAAELNKLHPLPLTVTLDNGEVWRKIGPARTTEEAVDEWQDQDGQRYYQYEGGVLDTLYRLQNGDNQ